MRQLVTVACPVWVSEPTTMPKPVLVPPSGFWRMLTGWQWRIVRSELPPTKTPLSTVAPAVGLGPLKRKPLIVGAAPPAISTRFTVPVLALVVGLLGIITIVLEELAPTRVRLLLISSCSV